MTVVAVHMLDKLFYALASTQKVHILLYAATHRDGKAAFQRGKDSPTVLGHRLAE